MSDQRILIIENPVYLSIDLGRLKIDRKGMPSVFVLPDDIAVLILEHHTINLSVAVLRVLSEAGASIMVTDTRHLPCALQIPLCGMNSGRLRQQMALDTSEQRGQLWQHLVIAKLNNQAHALRYLGKNGSLRLERLAGQVLYNDKGNTEGQGAKHYWKYLLTKEFKRDKQGAEDPFNIRLNYGYAVLRAMIARSLVASGLNCSLGLGHSNAGNAFNLADDFIEPFRFIVEIHVAQNGYNDNLLLNGAEKKNLLAFITKPVRIHKLDMRLHAAIDTSIASYIRILDGKDQHLILPEGLSENSTWESTGGE